MTRRTLFIPAILSMLMLLSCPTRALSQTDVIVAIGDSLVKGSTQYELMGRRNTIEGGWVARLSERLQRDAPGAFRVINRGVDAEMSRDVLARIERDVISEGPSIVIILVGTNDTYVHMTGGTAIVPPEEYRAVMSEMIERLQGGLPTARIFIVGLSAPLKAELAMTYFAPIFYARTQAFLDEQFAAYNAILKDVALAFGIVYIDIESSLPSDVDKRRALFTDGVHPSDAGYELMTDIIHHALAASGIGAAPSYCH